MADSRDMVVVHNMFRREFSAIPTLVGNVALADAAKAATVADHITWMVTFLHAHHEGEDLLVWPKLLDRAPGETDPLIHLMEEQHLALASALDDLNAKAAAWRLIADAAGRDALTLAATTLLVQIDQHLSLEEREVLPIIDQYLTAKEWNEVGGSGLKKMRFGQIKVAFGMILNGAPLAQVQAMKDTLPRVPWTVFSLVGPRAYAKYAESLRRASVYPQPVATQERAS